MQPPTITPTALLLVDLQCGLNHPTHFGSTRSTPNLESNIDLLLSTARTYNSTLASSSSNSNSSSNSPLNPNLNPPPHHPIAIIHIHHHSLSPTSPLHPSSTTSWLPPPNSITKGTAPLPCATPHPSEPVLIKSTNSAFIGTDLEARLRDARIKQIIVVGLTTEHCVSSTVRMAANLNVVEDPEGRGERGVVLVTDGCAAFGKGGDGRRVWEGEVVHEVEIECLRGEFAECIEMREVVACIEGSIRDGNGM